MLSHPRLRRFLVVGFIGLGVLALLFAGRSLATQIPTAAGWVERLGILAPIGFLLLYAVAEIAFVPGSLLTLAAGALFGPAWGTVVAMAGATLGSSVAFLMARYGLRRQVERRLQRSPRFMALDDAVAREGRKFVFLVRLTPIIPFNLLNYALGITRVRFRDYLLGSIGMLPGALVYAYYGHVAGSLTRVAAGGAPARGTWYYALLALGLLSAIVLTTVLTRLTRRALSARAPAMGT
ncbi:MAG: TVP38/TMEM64 family protein [Gemmatimonadales bacterium]